MENKTGMIESLWPYRWQIGLMPFFAGSVWLAFSLNITDRRTEFIAISLWYAFGDVLMVNAFVAESKRIRTLSQGFASIIFTGVFLYTYFAHREAEYALTQPLFWIATWKRMSEEVRPAWYPRMLDERALSVLITLILVAALVLFLCTSAIPTIINLMQTLGLCMFGGMLAVGNEIPAQRRRLWSMAGTIGLWIFTLCCLGDVAYKYISVGTVIATPFIAFFAALPVAIVSFRDAITPSRMR